MTGARAAGVLIVTGLVAAACVATRPPPVVTSPRYPEYPVPTIPVTLAADAAARQRHDVAWQRLQGGDLDGARRDFLELIQREPDLYPARAGLGFVELAADRPSAALDAFDAAVAAADDYLPAWIGRADVLLALGRDADAVAALERILAIDPSRDRTRGRLELVRFRAVQQLIAGGQEARVAGRLDEARDVLVRALELSPSSVVILQELVAVEREAARLDEAERYARDAVAAAPADAAPLVALGEVLAEQGQYAGAVEAYQRAVTIDARADWRDRLDGLRTSAALASVGGLEGLPDEPSVTRAQVAAYVGIRLAGLLARAPVRLTEIATDIRGHWAASWILPVTRAGVMTVYPNHTFQPDALVSRGDLATAASELIRLASTARPDVLAAWVAAEPRFADLPSTNVLYDDVALAVSAGVLSAGGDGEFRLSAPATGQDLVNAVGRLADLATP